MTKMATATVIKRKPTEPMATPVMGSIVLHAVCRWCDKAIQRDEADFKRSEVVPWTHAHSGRQECI